MPLEDRIVPHCFKCPLSLEVMDDPYIDKDGMSYEFSAISRWVTENHTSPLTRAHMELTELVPNRSLKEAIQLWKRSQNSIMLFATKLQDELDQLVSGNE